MAERKYKWDIDELNAALQRLKNAKSELERNKSFLQGLRAEIGVNWKGLSGQEYQGRLDLDMKNFEKVIEGLDVRIEKLNKIANKVYRSCEDDIRNAVGKMAGEISAI